MHTPDFFNDLLRILGVKHTAEYSLRRFRAMDFKSFFGLTILLKEYGVDTLGVHAADTTALTSIPTPFVAPVKAGEWVIVTATAPDTVTYLSQGIEEHATVAEFLDAWSGDALICRANPESVEPHYSRHSFVMAIRRLRDIAAIVCAIILVVGLMLRGHLFPSPATVGIVLFDFVGLAASFMLLQKQLGIHTRANDHVCAAIQREGCDTVISTTASTFLGTFHWSEVGMTYFSVSLIAVLVCPESIPLLALINACCLPYTIWSVLYQKFRAHAWCTLCLTVQATLWMLFLMYLWAGSWKHLLPLTWDMLMLPAAYGLVLCLLNRLMHFISTYRPAENESDKTS